MRSRMRTAAAVGAASAIALGGAIATAGGASATGTAGAGSDVNVHMTKSSIRLSSSVVHAGPTTFHAISNDGKYHMMQLARLHKGYTLRQAMQDIGKSFQGDVPAINRVDHRITFRGGGPARKSGLPGSVTVNLTRGSYIVIDQDGQGLARLTVKGTPRPEPTVVPQGAITAHTYGFTVEKHLPAAGYVRFGNISDQPHFVSMTHVKDGTTRRQVARALHSQRQPSWMLRAGTDSGVLSPYRHEVLRYRLPAGEYLVACWWPDDETGMPHALMGMWRLVQIG